MGHKEKKGSRAVLLHPITWMRKYYWAPVDNYTQPLNWQKHCCFSDSAQWRQSRRQWCESCCVLTTRLRACGNTLVRQWFKSPKTVFAPTDKASFFFHKLMNICNERVLSSWRSAHERRVFSVTTWLKFLAQSQEDKCIIGREQNSSFKCL